MTYEELIAATAAKIGLEGFAPDDDGVCVLQSDVGEIAILKCTDPLDCVLLNASVADVPAAADAALLAALKADCAEGNMAQSYMYHSGSFRMEDDYAEKGYYEMPELGISISGEKYTWWISIYPDSLHTLRWLQDHGALTLEVRPESIPY